QSLVKDRGPHISYTRSALLHRVEYSYDIVHPNLGDNGAYHNPLLRLSHSMGPAVVCACWQEDARRQYPHRRSHGDPPPVNSAAVTRSHQETECYSPPGSFPVLTHRSYLPDVAAVVNVVPEHPDLAAYQVITRQRCQMYAATHGASVYTLAGRQQQCQESGNGSGHTRLIRSGE
ncbi:unnamed protein product, partial [Phaeothamnion confervicola]